MGTKPKYVTSKICAKDTRAPLFQLAGNSLSKRLEQFMYVHGLSQKECAKKLGVDPATIRRVIEESGMHKATRNKLQNQIVFQ